MNLSRIFEPVSTEMELVKQELKTQAALMVAEAGFDGRQSLILDTIVQHPFTVPGKRIRPALVLLSFRAMGGSAPREALVTTATAVEVLHAASLIHDDIIDDADSRRHLPSLNKRFGNRVAVLAGDIFYTRFFSLITGLVSVAPRKRLRLLELFLETTRRMCMGEILAQDGAAAGRSLAFEEYLQIIGDKTASLFSACCSAAAVLGNAGEATARSLGDFGMSLGLAFQMMDDLVDRDYSLEPRVDLLCKAREQADTATQRVDALPPGESRDNLRELVSYVISQPIP